MTFIYSIHFHYCLYCWTDIEDSSESVSQNKSMRMGV